MVFCGEFSPSSCQSKSGNRLFLSSDTSDNVLAWKSQLRAYFAGSLGRQLTSGRGGVRFRKCDVETDTISRSRVV